jgi:large subunit ribosomal protein L29
MKASELKDKTVQELKEKLIDLKKESLNMRFQKKNGALQNTSRVSEVRKEIARILTVLRQKR